MAHEKEGGGRFNVDITLFDIEPDVAAIAPAARAAFKHEGHWANSTRDMWRKMVDRVALEKSIESAILGMVGPFAAGDVKRALGRNVNVSPVLKRLVDEKRLLPFGQKRGRRYEVTPPTFPERIDWVG